MRFGETARAILVGAVVTALHLSASAYLASIPRNGPTPLAHAFELVLWYPSFILGQTSLTTPFKLVVLATSILWGIVAAIVVVWTRPIWTSRQLSLRVLLIGVTLISRVRDNGRHD